MGEAGGRRPSPLPLPAPPRLPGGSGSRTTARPPRLALAAPPACQGRAWRAGARAAAAGPGRVLGARPERPPSPRLARAQGTATDAAPAPPPRTPRRGQMWADVEAGRRRGGGAEGGRDSSPSLGRRAPCAGGFIYAAKQSWPPPPPSRAQRLRGLSGGAPGSGGRTRACWLRTEGREQESRGPGSGGGGTPSSYSPPHPSTPSGAGDRESADPRRRGQGGAPLSELPGACAAPALPRRDSLKAEGREDTGRYLKEGGGERGERLPGAPVPQARPCPPGSNICAAPSIQHRLTLLATRRAGPRGWGQKDELELEKQPDAVLGKALQVGHRQQKGGSLPLPLAEPAGSPAPSPPHHLRFRASAQRQGAGENS